MVQFKFAILKSHRVLHNGKELSHSKRNGPDGLSYSL